jgi:hypothetical protein
MDVSSWNYRGDQIPPQRPMKIGSRPVYRLPPASRKGGRASTVASWRVDIAIGLCGESLGSAQSAGPEKILLQLLHATWSIHP